ncbi:fumarate reductase flavoprotein subunit [Ferrimonas lipolytica]|uniref:succinate dehydrogenase n=1 Tax=Ferrimonas lipolytica TaxID=2724191 RepID=A0A6H1UHM8_9GAMM|nr:fumarate reductase flavoprotein subunit [Ferrimonas lipolytica]QIZ78607.1 fumarate reductase flavoprotein subunit [Ferrimonas lipolytica]
MKTITTDALIIGAGLAGLRVALACQAQGQQATVLSLVPAKRSHSSAAQGGMQASLGNSVKSQGDDETAHFIDTVKGSDWGCDQTVARMFAHVAPKAVRQSAEWGVPWSRIKAGPRQAVINGKTTTIKEAVQTHGLIHARDFGGTKHWRTCYTSDGTGHSLLYAMDNKAIAAGIEVHERVEALQLIHDGQRCQGAIVRDLVSGELIAYLAKTTTICSGGYGRLWSASTNALICEGTGTSMALETGLVPIGNPEAVQFHPTAIVPAGILVTEGCRGDGGVLRDVDGHRFMPDYEPEKKELASRDVVSRRMTEHMRTGKGVKSPYGEHLWLDITQLGAAHIDKNLREVKDICNNFLGIDPAKDWIPVRPTQHYSMGGIRTNEKGEAYGLAGLFAVGEAACWDLHGFNRLGGNSLAETVVGGMIIGEHVAAAAKQTDAPEEAVAVPHWHAVAAEIDALLQAEQGNDPYDLREQMEQIMMDKVGIFRTGTELEQAVVELEQLQRQASELKLHNRTRHSNPELVEALRVRKMLKLAVAVAKGALARTESRGAHAREDYPQRNDNEWLKRTMVHWRNDAAELSYEAIDISKMELPPGFRGYGEDNTIAHPDSAVRLAQVEQWQQQYPDATEQERQQALMPYELPTLLSQPNQRRGVGK